MTDAMQRGYGWVRLSRADDGDQLWIQWADVILVTRADDGTHIALRGCPQIVAVRESVAQVMKIVRHPMDGAKETNG